MPQIDAGPTDSTPPPDQDAAARPTQIARTPTGRAALYATASRAGSTAAVTALSASTEHCRRLRAASTSPRKLPTTKPLHSTRNRFGAPLSRGYTRLGVTALASASAEL